MDCTSSDKEICNLKKQWEQKELDEILKGKI